MDQEKWVQEYLDAGWTQEPTGDGALSFSKPTPVAVFGNGRRSLPPPPKGFTFLWWWRRWWPPITFPGQWPWDGPSAGSIYSWRMCIGPLEIRRWTDQAEWWRKKRGELQEEESTS